MTIVNAELYMALIDAGADEEKARKAAATLISYKKEEWKDIHKDFQKDLFSLKWMVGFNLVINLVILIKLFL